MKEQAEQSFKERARYYKGEGGAREWFERNQQRLRQLFENDSIRRFVFEPVQEIFDYKTGDTDSAIRSAITQVAVANAVMAGLPGKMGVGVFVSIALEAWMAYVIAQRVGIKIEKPSDIWAYLGAAAGILITILWLFKQLLSFGFSLFSVVPWVNPLIPAELLVTSFVGVFFWTAFTELKTRDRFALPTRAFLGIGRETKSLFRYQFELAKHALSPSNLEKIGSRLKAWFQGDVGTDIRNVRGEMFTATAMVYLLAGRQDQLDGPLGEEFLASIRDRFPELETESVRGIADFMQAYDPDQLVGVISLIKGRLFERLVMLEENSDGDRWSAISQEDMSHRGADLIFLDAETGTEVEVSLKATDSVAYIEDALLKYPEIPLLATEEVSQLFGDDASVIASTWTNEELKTVTEQNFEALLSQLNRFDVAAGAGSSRALAAAASLWPFVVAYLKDRIDRDQLSGAFERVLGDEGKRISSRVTWAVVFGPIFGWFLLARSVMLLCRVVPTEEVEKVRLEAKVMPAFRPSDAISDARES